MKSATSLVSIIAFALWTAGAGLVSAADWPQYRGANRDGKVSGFEGPETWPAALTEKWKISVGDGVASPTLVDGKIYVYTREEGDEILRCLDADTGEEIWRQAKPARPVSGAAGGFPGPRSTPAVTEGKVVAIGVEGVLTCYDAENGTELWSVTSYRNNVPRFSTSSSPLIVDGRCIAQLGGARGGGVMAAYDLATGEEVWKYSSEAGPAYGSPILVPIGEVQAIVAPTDDKLVALNAADGKPLWEIEYAQGRYNAATPMLVGDTLVFAGPTRGLTAVKFTPNEEELLVEDAWRNDESSVQFNTPVIRDNLMFGLSNLNSLFCVDGRTGEAAWYQPIGLPEEARQAEGPRAEAAPRQQPPRGGGRRGGGGGGRRGGGGGGGYGTVVDAGSVIVALPENGQLIVFEPTDEAFRQVASYQLAPGGTYGYPILTGNRIYVKDRDSLTLWTVE